MNNLIIRRPNLEDRAQIHKLFKKVMIDTFRVNNISYLTELMESELIFKHAYLDSDYQSKGDQRYFLVGEINRKIVACIEHGSPNDDMIRGSGGVISDMQEIGTVYVDPDYQKQGIGNKMLQGMYKRLLDIGETFFGLDSGFISAQKIWMKKFGEPTYFLKDFWGEDAHHMIWLVKLEQVIE